jgi:hypothetical protein
MRILFRVAIGVMHPVKNGIGPWVKEGGALGKKGKSVKKSLPELIHSKHLMRSIPMQEKSLRK